MRAERVNQRAGRIEGPPRLVDLADHHRRAERPAARGERNPAEDRLDQRRLARAVGALHEEAICPGQLQVHRAEPERAPVGDCSRQRGHDVPAAPGCPEAQPQLPLLARLLDHLEPVRLAHGCRCPGTELLSALCPGMPDVLVWFLPAGSRAVCRPFPGTRPFSLPAGTLGQLVAPGGIGLVFLPGAHPVALELGLVGRESAAVTAGPVRVLVQLDHLAGHPLQEGPVVGHHHEAAAEPGQMPLQQFQAAGVEVVGGLIEEDHVEAGEQHRGQREPGGLPAGQARRPAAVVGRQPEGSANLGEPDLQIRPA